MDRSLCGQEDGVLRRLVPGSRHEMLEMRAGVKRESGQTSTSWLERWVRAKVRVMGPTPRQGPRPPSPPPISC